MKLWSLTQRGKMDNSPIPPPPPPATQLIQTLEQATQMAKQLRTATDPTHLLQIYTSLHQTHHFLSSFLQQALALFPATAGGEEKEEEEEEEGEPMQVVGEEEEEEGEGGVDKVEERLRNCFIKNKRVKKRHLSPSSVAAGEERRLGDDGGCVVGVVEGFDPLRTRVRSLELVHQFHA